MVACSKKLVNADKLLGGLGGEAKRWAETVKKLTVLEVNIIGDVLVSAASVSYLGPVLLLSRLAIQKGTAAFLGTRPNISESHSEISTRVPFCIALALAGLLVSINVFIMT